MPRKGENIYKRKDGRWEGRYIKGYDIMGKAKYGYIYAKTYSEVKVKLKQCLQTTSSNEAISSNEKGKTYNHWLDLWLATKKNEVKESTFIRYLNIVDNHIRKDLGQYPIEKINSFTLEQFINKKYTCGRLDNQGGLSAKTIQDILMIIKESFKYAQYHGVIINCSFEHVLVKNTPHEMRVLSYEEEKRLNKVLTQDTDRYKLGVIICLYTGIRIGELCALKWENITDGENILIIQNTMQRLQYSEKKSIKKTRIIITEPKSIHSKRSIPLPDCIIEYINQFRTNPTSFLLTGKSDKFIEPRTMQNKFKSFLQEAEIDDANFHCLRHTFATRSIEAGFDIKSLSEILGHSSVKITLDKYVHSSTELKRSNMNKLQMA